MPRANDKVVVRLEEWESRHLNPEGEIIEVLGPARAPGVDILGIIKKYDLPVEFSSGALEQAEKIPLEYSAIRAAPSGRSSHGAGIHDRSGRCPRL